MKLEQDLMKFVDIRSLQSCNIEFSLSPIYDLIYTGPVIFFSCQTATSLLMIIEPIAYNQGLSGCRAIFGCYRLMAWEGLKRNKGLKER